MGMFNLRDADPLGNLFNLFLKLRVLLGVFPPAFASLFY